MNPLYFDLAHWIAFYAGSSATLRSIILAELVARDFMEGAKGAENETS